MEQLEWPSAAHCPNLPRLQIMHASGHLIGTRDQGREGEWPLTAPQPVGAEVRAWGASGPQELPQVSLGGTLHNHIQGPCGGEGDRKAAEAVLYAPAAPRPRPTLPHLPGCRHPAD